MRSATAERPCSAPEAGPIDFAHLAIYTAGNHAIETEILALFATQILELRGQAGTAACAEQWKYVSHSMKGCARSVGAWHLASVAADLESEARVRPAAAHELARLDAAIADALDAVERHRKT